MSHSFLNMFEGNMLYLIIGTIIALSAIGLMIYGLNLFGIILLLIAAYLGIKGRNKFDKKGNNA